jgi:hypothetical protein
MDSKHYASALAMLIAMSGYGGMALAADPSSQTQSARASGGEVIEFGDFQCTAKADGSQAIWTCPVQSFDAKFKDSPVVFFSIAGFDQVTPEGSGWSLDIETKGEVNKDSFQPAVNAKLGKVTDKSAIKVTWIAIGEGEKARRPALTREEKLKAREMRREEKPKDK